MIKRAITIAAAICLLSLLSPQMGKANAANCTGYSTTSTRDIADMKIRYIGQETGNLKFGISAVDKNNPNTVYLMFSAQFGASATSTTNTSIESVTVACGNIATSFRPVLLFDPAGTTEMVVHISPAHIAANGEIDFGLQEVILGSSNDTSLLAQDEATFQNFPNAFTGTSCTAAPTPSCAAWSTICSDAGCTPIEAPRITGVTIQPQLGQSEPGIVFEQGTTPVVNIDVGISNPDPAYTIKTKLKRVGGGVIGAEQQSTAGSPVVSESIDSPNIAQSGSIYAETTIHELATGNPVPGRDPVQSTPVTTDLIGDMGPPVAQGNGEYNQGDGEYNYDDVVRTTIAAKGDSPGLWQRFKSHFFNPTGTVNEVVIQLRLFFRGVLSFLR